jgi:hypothetical protein
MSEILSDINLQNIQKDKGAVLKMKLSREFIIAILTGIGFTFGVTIAMSIVNIVAKMF